MSSLALLILIIAAVGLLIIVAVAMDQWIRRVTA